MYPLHGTLPKKEEDTKHDPPSHHMLCAEWQTVPQTPRRHPTEVSQTTPHRPLWPGGWTYEALSSGDRWILLPPGNCRQSRQEGGGGTRVHCPSVLGGRIPHGPHEPVWRP